MLNPLILTDQTDHAAAICIDCGGFLHVKSVTEEKKEPFHEFIISYECKKCDETYHTKLTANPEAPAGIPIEFWSWRQITEKLIKSIALKKAMSWKHYS